MCIGVSHRVKNVILMLECKRTPWHPRRPNKPPAIRAGDLYRSIGKHILNITTKKLLQARIIIKPQIYFHLPEIMIESLYLARADVSVQVYLVKHVVLTEGGDLSCFLNNRNSLGLRHEAQDGKWKWKCDSALVHSEKTFNSFILFMWNISTNAFHCKTL